MTITKRNATEWDHTFAGHGDHNESQEINATPEGLEIDYDTIPWAELDEARVALDPASGGCLAGTAIGAHLVQVQVQRAILAERERCAKLAADPALCLIILRGSTHPADALVNAINSGLPAVRPTCANGSPQTCWRVTCREAGTCAGRATESDAERSAVHAGIKKEMGG